MQEAKREIVTKNRLVPIDASLSITSKASGGVSGLATTAITGNPIIGSVTSAVVTVLVEKTGKYFLKRQLDTRQQNRVQDTVRIARDIISARIVSGDQIRPDDFFNFNVGDRSNAEEVMEGGLQAASQSYEERKIPFIARAMANVCFRDDVDLATFNSIIGILNIIGYRGIIIIYLANQIENYSFNKRPDKGNQNSSFGTSSLCYEVFRLLQMGIVEFKEQKNCKWQVAVLGYSDIEPAFLRLANLGLLILELCGISELEATDTLLLQTIKGLTEISNTPNGTPTAVDGGDF